MMEGGRAADKSALSRRSALPRNNRVRRYTDFVLGCIAPNKMARVVVAASDMLGKIKSSVIRHGVGGTVKLIPRNVATLARTLLSASDRDRCACDEFDRTHGTDTAGYLDVSDYHDVSPIAAKGAHGYQTFSRDAIFDMLNYLAIDFSRFTFIDYGSGKGRSLLVATEFPFTKIIGVELSPRLDEIARSNIQIFPPARGRNIVSLCRNATEFQPPSVSTVFFFYNPFEMPIMIKVVEEIERVHSCSSHPVYALYIGPKCREVFDRSKFWKIRFEERAGVAYERRFACAVARGESKLLHVNT